MNDIKGMMREANAILDKNEGTIHWYVFSYGGNIFLEAGFVFLDDALAWAAMRKDTDYEEDFIVMTVVEI